MSLCSVFSFYFISLISLCVCFTLPSARKVEAEKGVDDPQVDNNSIIILVLLKPHNRDDDNNNDEGTHSNRVKRQSDLSKFSASKNLSQTKIVQLYLQLYRDLYYSRYNPKPLHPDSMKPVLTTFKKKLVRFFFPEAALQTYRCCSAQA